MSDDIVISMQDEAGHLKAQLREAQNHIEHLSAENERLQTEKEELIKSGGAISLERAELAGQVEAFRYCINQLGRLPC